MPCTTDSLNGDCPNDLQQVARYYQAAGVRHFYRFDECHLPLRQLTRAYCRLIHTLVAEKAFWLSLVYLTASEYVRLTVHTVLQTTLLGSILVGGCLAEI